jgi:hypothetical protein
MNRYASPYSEIELQQDKNLLIFSWLKNSETLLEEEVKSEIIKILEYVDQYAIENVIVDSSDYYFTENPAIQSWINYQFMEMIMNTPVKKYCFVLKSMSQKYEDHNNENNDENLKVAYFINLTDACKWIDA